MLLGLVGLALGAGCVMHDQACYARCMERHRECITSSQTPAALERCDADLVACRGGCSW